MSTYQTQAGDIAIIICKDGRIVLTTNEQSETVEAAGGMTKRIGQLALGHAMSGDERRGKAGEVASIFIALIQKPALVERVHVMMEEMVMAGEAAPVAPASLH
ncbi:hypothetical protein [Paracoccus litorisediminis]|uniref:Uncharacterized protein n=1 Tax=Paracoccus litorisediminis TaxID=2006130 RepID=A0A844HQ00_9RHOB|nr:hypothetical protein [Paracoccus litorisediminis]MTH61138.1 hypothetical protein [Paracoccus litorisediminis]